MYLVGTTFNPKNPVSTNFEFNVDHMNIQFQVILTRDLCGPLWFSIIRISVDDESV